MLYRWLIFLHVFGAILFFMGHGATALAMFDIQKTRDPERILALMGLRSTQMWSFASGGLLLVITSIWLGFLGEWWRSGWIWASILLYIIIMIFMSQWGRAYYDSIEMVLDPEGERAKKAKSVETRSLDEIISGGKTGLLTWIGIGGTAIILWLMYFKPF
jgi:uncharacterized membrane protein